MYSENPFDAEFGGIPELYLDFNNDTVKYAKRAHRYTKNIPLTHFLLLVFMVQVKQFL